MKILLVYPQPDDKSKQPRYGFSYDMLEIATVLKNYHEVIIKDYSCEEYNSDWLLKKIEKKELDLLIVECDSFALKRSQNIEHAKNIIDLVSGNISIIAYGNYCCITKRNFYKADYTVKCNDINALIATINIFSEVKIPNILNFDAIPHIDRTILLSIDYYNKNRYSTLLITSKGCENTCIFCQRKGWQDHYIAHSNSYVLNELNELKMQDYKNIWITDENFSFNLLRAKKLLKEILESSLIERMNLFISSWANIDEEFLELAKNCNIRIISFGIESGNQDILKFYRKNINLTRVPQIIQYANKIGIFTVGNFILGAPMETKETIQQTFSLIQECQFDQINIKTLDYMLGSELYENLDDNIKSGKDHIFACAENGLTTLPLKYLVEQKKLFKAAYYSLHKETLKQKIEKFGTPYFKEF